MSRFSLRAPLFAMASTSAASSSAASSSAGSVAGASARRGPGGPGARLMSSATLCGGRVVNHRGELLGTVSELMLDVERGCIGYVVMAHGGFMGMGERLYALPWSALRLEAERGCFVLDAERSTFETAPAFDKDHWPTTPDREWHREVHRHYRSLPYWD